MVSHEIEDLNYMVSLYCPGKCLNCGLWKADKKEVTRGELAVELFEKALQSKALGKAFYFDLSGGESQLSANYLEAVRLIARYRPGAFIHTNISGWYPEKHYRVTGECLKYVDPGRFRVDVSLDGAPANYQKVRFVADGWEQAVQTITALRDLGIVLRIVFITHKQNYRDIQWVADFSEKLGVGYYIGFSRQANLLKNIGATDLSFSPDELEQIEKTLERIGFMETSRKSHWLWARSVYSRTVPYFDCYMGRRALVIDPYGNVFPCNDLQPGLRMGNVRAYQGDLDALLASEDAVSVLEKVRNKACQPCTMLCAHKAVFPWGAHTGVREGALPVPAARA